MSTFLYKFGGVCNNIHYFGIYAHTYIAWGKDVFELLFFKASID